MSNESIAQIWLFKRERLFISPIRRESRFLFNTILHSFFYSNAPDRLYRLCKSPLCLENQGAGSVPVRPLKQSGDRSVP